MIGRAPDSDLCLTNVKGASRYHARLSTKGEKYTLVDLNSTNGTFVNGERIGTSDLSQGDIIHIGNATITLSSGKGEEEEQVAKDGPSTQEVDTIDNPSGEVSPILKEISQKALPNPKGNTGIHKVADDFLKTTLSALLSPIWAYVCDETVSHILVKGCDAIYIERDSLRSKTGATFSEQELEELHKHLCNECEVPSEDLSAFISIDIDDYTQINVILPPLTERHAVIDVRKRPKKSCDLSELISSGFLTAEILSLLESSVKLGKNILVSGPRRCGKTSLLQVLLNCAGEKQSQLIAQKGKQIVSSHESAIDLLIPKGGIEQLCTSVAALDCDINLIDELPQKSVYEFLDLIVSKAPGFLLGIEAGTPSGALAQLESMALTSPSASGHIEIRSKVASAIDLIVQIQQDTGGNYCISDIVEVPPLNSSALITPVFLYHSVEGDPVESWTGEVPSFLDDLERQGLVEALDLFTEVIS